MKESISMRETPSSYMDLWMAFLSLTALSRISSPSFVSINLLTVFSTTEALTNGFLCSMLHNQTNLEHLCGQNCVSWLVRVHRQCSYWLSHGYAF